MESIIDGERTAVEVSDILEISLGVIDGALVTALLSRGREADLLEAEAAVKRAAKATPSLETHPDEEPGKADVITRRPADGPEAVACSACCAASPSSPIRACATLSAPSASMARSHC